MSVVRKAALIIFAAKEDCVAGRPVFEQRRPYWFPFAGDQIIAAQLLSAVNLDRNRRPNILTLLRDNLAPPYCSGVM